MIKVDIITSEMRFLNGANRVTEYLVNGHKLFLKNGIKLNYLYTDNYSVKCEDYVSTLGNEGAVSSPKKKNIVRFLKETFAYKTSFAQSLLHKRVIKNAKKSVVRFFGSNQDTDCIIFQDIYCAYHFLKSNKRKNIRTILITHTDTDPLEQLFIDRPKIRGTRFERNLRKLFEYVFTNVEKVIAICPQAQEFLSSFYHINVSCVMNGITDLSLPYVQKPHYAFPLQVVILGTIGLRKGHDLLVNGFSLLTKEEKEKFVINVVGAGSNFNMIKDLVNEKYLDGYFVLYGEMRNVEELLNKMDVMILPSRADTVPIAIIEGLRSGLPVFSTNKGEIPNMIEGCGLLIDASEKGVADAFRFMQYNLEKLPELSAKSRKKYEDRYSVSKMIEGYSNEINILVNNKQEVIKNN